MSQPVSRLQANLMLLGATMVWGLAFVAQKSGLQGLGTFGFIGLRFALSAVMMLPFAWREHTGAGEKPAVSRHDRWRIVGLLLAFFAGVGAQQAGVRATSVTHAGFLTALYIIATPLTGLLIFRHLQTWIIWPACAIALIGVWLLNGAAFDHLSPGDGLILICAVCFAFQINLMAVIVQRTRRPFLICLIQNGVTAVAALLIGAITEGITLAGIMASGPALLYTGLISGGVGFALQAYAQQYTPPSNAAIIMSAEALFAAFGGAVLLHERMNAMSWAGCGLIFAAIILVEASPLLIRRT